jgi:ketosteroid isomerase-like protein
VGGSREIVLGALRDFEREAWNEAPARWREDAWISGPPDWPESEPFRGREAVLGQFRRLAADWHSHSFEDLQLEDHGGGWVVVEFTWVVQGTASGVPVEARFAAAYRVEGGLIAEAHFRRSRDELAPILSG